MPAVAVLVLFATGSAFLGTLGGLGGALFLVPVLVLAGVDPLVAVPLGATSVGAGSLAAGAPQIRAGLVHQRIGVTIEVVAVVGAVVGAAIGDRVSAEALTWVLAAVALLAAISAARPTAPYNLPQASFGGELGGEWPGTLGGAYRLGDEVVPYEAKRVPAALSLMSVAGLVSGLAGVGGGFMKVPVMREVMRVPIKVAAATSTFTVGVTAAVSLIVYWRQGRVDLAATSAVIIGAVIGGVVGTRVSARLAPTTTRRVIAVLLAAVAVILVVR
jgi:uncharacterized membrane protein YfcA